MICERSLKILLNGWKVMNQSLISLSWRESLFEKVERNIFLNISFLILMLMLITIKINKSIPPSTKLETNLSKSLKRRDYPFHPQLTWRKISVHSMRHRTLQSSFSWRNFAVIRMDLHKVRYMIALLVSKLFQKILLILNPEYTSV